MVDVDDEVGVGRADDDDGVAAHELSPRKVGSS
jgi:hypothetical protein